MKTGSNDGLIIGLGGSIGSGKSVVRRAFEILSGWHTFDSDAEAKALYFDPEVRRSLIAELDTDPVTPEGTLDKAALRLLMNNPGHKAFLEKTVHTTLFRKLREVRAALPEREILLAESAILFTSGLAELCHATIAVTAPEEVRKGRVLERDKEKGELFFEEMENRQKQERIRLEEADYRILNCDPHSVLLQVDKITKQIDRYVRN